MSDDNFKISSEIHLHSEVDQAATPTLSPENVVTRFFFKTPIDRLSAEKSKTVEVDEDGDFILQRRGSSSPKNSILLIEQKPSTSLELVGLQVWRGALLLSDFILHHGKSLLHGATVLELGAGAGLTSIVAAMFAHEVVSTVIYDNDVTEAFVDLLARLLEVPPTKVVYVALEKRYVFTVADLECVAPCYEYFLQCLAKIRNKPPASNWLVEQLPIDFPQYFSYDRVKELVLWKISTQ